MAGLYEVDVVGKKQEIGDTIYIAESHKTPITRLMPRGKRPNQMLCEWEAQKYSDKGFGGTLDGKDITNFGHSTPEKLSGYAMLLQTEGWMVTVLTQLIKAAGVPNQQAKQAMDDSLDLGKMHEKQILSTVDTRTESGINAYRSRGVFSWLNPEEQTVLPVPANFRPATACTYTGAIASFLPANMVTMLNAMATAKKGPVDLTMPAGISLKAQMSGWPQLTSASTNTQASVTSYNLDASEKKLLRIVDEFLFDAGTVRSILSFYNACTEADGTASAYTPLSGPLLDLSMWELCYLLAPSTFEVADAGGGPRGFHRLVAILKCLNPLGQGYVLTNS